MAKKFKQIVPVAADIMAARRQNTITELSFPLDLGPHAIIFNFSEYSFDRETRVQNSVMKSSIALPIPANLQDSFKVRLSSNELGFLGAASTQAAAMIKELAGAGVDPTKMDMTLLSDKLKEYTKAGDDWNDAMTRTALKNALMSINSSSVKGIEIGKGIVTNPHIALSFDGIDLKSHSFEWTLMPRNAQESKRIKDIIRTISRNILPKYANLNEDIVSADSPFLSRIFLKYPNVVDIFFLGTESGYLYHFKRAMVADFTVDYAGAGEIAFLENGRPAAVKLQLALTETEIHTRDDFEDDE